MDCKIKNGDIVVDSCGRYIRLSGDEELLQRAYIKLACNAGSFFYNRNLGINNAIKTDVERFADRFNLIIKESLIDYPNVCGEVVDILGDKIKIRLKCGLYEREDILAL